MIVLGVETSCDETAVAIVKDGKEVLSDVIYSQINTHEKYGGVVPEVASREHIQKIISVFDEAILKAGIKVSDIDLVAVTTHPGLIGSLLVGVNAARAFALANHIKCIGVDHIYGHIYANYVESDFDFPTLALVVSGGHTELVLMNKHYDFTVLGETFDDAVGEAYDKVARVVGLTYPGGVKVDRLACEYEGEELYNLAIYNNLDDYNFSFSGIKSAVLNLVNKCNMKGEEVNVSALCFAFQDAVTNVLTLKTIKAAKEFNARQIIVAGGVAANKGLRAKLIKEAGNANIKITFPSIRYCTDNAVMIAVAGYFQELNSRK